MKKYEFFASLMFSLLVGSGFLLTLLGNTLFNKNTETHVDVTIPAPLLISTQIPAVTQTSTPEVQFIGEAHEKSADIEDVLLLYDAKHPVSFDMNFCKIAEYYGLLCKTIPIDEMEVTDTVLRDAKNAYYKLIGLDESNLRLLSETEIALLKSTIKNGGVDIFISGSSANVSTVSLSALTNGLVTSASFPVGSLNGWHVSEADPEITREFTGQKISPSTGTSHKDFALLISNSPNVKVLISSSAHDGSEYPVFVYCHYGIGFMFVDSGGGKQNLNDLPLRKMYYDKADFSNIVSLMMAMRFAAGDEAWHNDHDYANLTIDDPTLSEPYYQLSYPALLHEMQSHNFHTTIALIPAKWQRFNLDVVGLFQQYPDRFSIVQHGNNHDGYEFYKYSLTSSDPQDNPDFRARPLEEQEADIVEGLARLREMSQILELPFDQVMVFPNGISPSETFSILKKYNYLATVNAQDVPLGAVRPSAWDYGMYPAELSYENFPSLTRRHPGTYLPFQPDIEPFIFDLFIDKPALFYSHADEEEIFASGVDAFDIVADQMNSLQGDLEWDGLGYILKHLYLEKVNDDGSMDIRMYSSQVILNNDASSELTYHILKPEISPSSFITLTINDRRVPFQIKNNLLTFDVRISAGTSINILVHYGE